MAKFYGTIGYAITVENPDNPGEWIDKIVERDYYGDALKFFSKTTNSDHVNQNLQIGNSISIYADAFSMANFAHIRYVTWMGVRWTATNVEVQRPRLIITLGGEYNGPTKTQTPCYS